MTATEFGALDLEQIPAAAWDLLADGVARAASPFHAPVLATTGADGPEVRTVVLRGADPRDPSITIHTDRRSPKFEQIARAARVACLFYDPPGKIQLRVRGVATLHTEDEMAEQRWAASTPSARQCYRLANPPGVPLEQRPAAAPVLDDSGRGNFAVIGIQLFDLDWLYLQAAGHQRARFAYLDGAWRGGWVAP
jgi:hypothetical protein